MALVPGIVSYDAVTKTGTFTPNVPLKTNTRYEATLTTAIQSIDSLPLAIEFKWSFTTSNNPGETIWDDTVIPADLGKEAGVEVNLGTWFNAAVAGEIAGLRYYRSPGTNGPIIGKIWDEAQTELATVTFTGESASGWQNMLLATPLAITAGTNYLATIYYPTGNYPHKINTFTVPIVNGNLTALQDGVPLSNGRFNYGAATVFPANSNQARGYFSDVIFQQTDFSVNVDAIVDALTLTEQTSTIKLEIPIAAVTDALTLTEQTSTIKLEIPIAAVTDALTLTEHVATIAVEAPVCITAIVDELSLSEQVATISLHRRISATSDSLTLTEFSSTISGLKVDFSKVSKRSNFGLMAG